MPSFPLRPQPHHQEPARQTRPGPGKQFLPKNTGSFKGIPHHWIKSNDLCLRWNMGKCTEPTTDHLLPDSATFIKHICAGCLAKKLGEVRIHCINGPFPFLVLSRRPGLMFAEPLSTAGRGPPESTPGFPLTGTVASSRTFPFPLQITLWQWFNGTVSSILALNLKYLRSISVTSTGSCCSTPAWPILHSQMECKDLPRSGFFSGIGR